MGITNDEAGGFLSQLPHMMSELHAASDGSDIRHDRASTPSAFVEQPRISLVLAVQPRFWIRFLAGHEMDYAETGLGPRTLLVVIRDRRTQYRAEQPSRDARDDYRATIKRLLSSYAAKLQAADLSREILTFTPDAQKQFKATEKWLNEEAQSGGVFATIRPYANRCAETIARIAAVLHVIEGRVESAIQLDTLLHAIAIGRWFALHYLDLFEHTGIPQIERDAQAILKVLQRRAVSYGPEWMPKSTLRQYLPTSDDLRSDLGRVEEALNFLLRRNVIMTATGTRADRFILNTTSPHMAG